MRGEDKLHFGENVGGFGSPPHARGRLSQRLQCRSRGWITPACAGKTIVAALRTPIPEDHPRMRGEDTVEDAVEGMLEGSPPHARGRRPHGHRGVGRPGITPACAGKTSAVEVKETMNRDHPRMRGEDWSSDDWQAALAGSPPHARGRQRNGHGPQVEDGITPACAGKTPAPSAERTTKTDHPRMRGEDGADAVHGLPGRGSPPHARGRLRPSRPAGLPAGITPACAGKTPCF